ncbi:MAG: hypothetical protein JNL69_04965 [Bacteroidia bacterium]|nr:hypothetical protein [Bacteroidia bacterium]
METNEDLKKYFNSKEYHTAIVGADNYENDDADLDKDKIATLISLLADPKNKEVKEETLLTLKKEKGSDLLIAAIKSKKAKENKHILIAACWESEINFSNYLLFFTDLAVDTDYLVSLEAITVIENMEGPFKKDELTTAIQKIKEEQKKINSERLVLYNDLVDTLSNFLSKE